MESLSSTAAITFARDLEENVVDSRGNDIFDVMYLCGNEINQQGESGG